MMATPEELERCCYTRTVEVKRGSSISYMEVGSISVSNVAAVLMDRFHFVNSRNDDSLYAYIDGVYVNNGEKIVDEFLTHSFKHLENLRGNPELSQYKRKEIMKLIKTDKWIDEREWDRDPRVINLKNGLFDIDSGVLKPHSHEHYSRIQLPIEYNPDAKCPACDEFINKVVSKDDVRKLMEWIGYCMYKGYPIQKALIIYGPGGTYKSILLKIITDLIGENNQSAIPIQKLEDNRFAAAGLIGKLVNMVADLPPTRIKSTGMLKSLTSGIDHVNMEKKFKESFQACSFAKQIFSANELPIVSDKSTGFYRRVDIIQLVNRNAEVQHLIPALSSKEELQGLFNKVVSMLPALLERRHFTNEIDIQTARELYNARSDTIQAFIDACVQPECESYTPKETMYSYYVSFCGLNYVEPLKYDFFCKRYKETADSHEEQKIKVGEGRKWCWVDTKVIKPELVV